MYNGIFVRQKTAYEMRISDGSSDVCASDLGQEVGEHAVPVLAGESAEVDRDAEPAADGNGVAAVVLGPAVAAAVVGPVLHEQTRDRLAGIAQQQRGHGGIDAAGHADNRSRRGHDTCQSSDSGWRWPERKSATTCQTSGLR